MGNRQSTEPHRPRTSSGHPVTRLKPQQALENGVLGRLKSAAPVNLEELRSRLDQDGGTSPAPSESIYNGYVDGFQCAENEQTMLYEIWRRLLKVYDCDQYRTTLDHSFTAFPRNVGFNNGLAAARPGLFQGFGELSFEPFPISRELGGAAVVLNNAVNSIALPHLAGEFKGPGKNMEETRLQSAYDGAALVYGRNHALRYLGDADPYGHAAVITFTTDGDSVHFYAHYSAFSAETGRLEYHQYPIFEPNHPSLSYEEYVISRKRLHNAQDFAREAAHDLRRRLKGHWRAGRGSAAAGGRPDSGDARG